MQLAVGCCQNGRRWQLRNSRSRPESLQVQQEAENSGGRKIGRFRQDKTEPEAAGS